MCKILEVSRSGYYSWLTRKPSERAITSTQLLDQIRKIHKQSRQTYGAPRIAAELNSSNFQASRPRVARIMKHYGIRSKTVKKFRVTTNSKHNYQVVENKLNRQFKVDEPGKVWVSDITYIATGQGWLYLTIILDLGDRKVIGWSLSNSLKTKGTTVPAWRMAVINRPITRPLIFHSDRGVQYCSNQFSSILKSYRKVSRSMSRKGNCWDNAVAESFFKTIKTELIYNLKFQTIRQAKMAVFEYIEIWYNKQRRHSALGYLSPESYNELLINYKKVA